MGQPLSGNVYSQKALSATAQLGIAQPQTTEHETALLETAKPEKAQPENEQITQPQAPKFWLVTHSTELLKPTNTGQLLMQLAAQQPSISVQQVQWQRKEPDAALLAALQAPSLLVYPAADAISISLEAWQQDVRPIDFGQIQHLILLDATWQLAHKMFKQSPYLQQLPAIQLCDAPPSEYTLRRNQREVGWCTAEIAIMLLALCQQSDAVSQLQQRFCEFNQGKASLG